MLKRDCVSCTVYALTSDPGHRDDLPLHHVVDVEEFVPHACGHHLLSVCAETRLIHREFLQVDALDLGIGLTIHLRGERERTEAPDVHLCELILRTPAS